MGEPVDGGGAILVWYTCHTLGKVDCRAGRSATYHETSSQCSLALSILDTLHLIATGPLSSEVFVLRCRPLRLVRLLKGLRRSYARETIDVPAKDDSWPQ